MTEKKQIIKDTFQLTTSRYLSQGIGFFTSIFMRRFLGPYYIGRWNILRLILDYSSYVLFGINEGVSYKVPLLIGKNDKEEERRTIFSVFTLILLTSLALSAILLIAASLLRRKFPPEVIVGLTAIAVYIILDRFFGFYMLLLRARKNFSLLSKSIAFDAVANIVLIFLLVRSFKIYGLYATLIVLSALNILFIHLFAKYRFRLIFNFKAVPQLFKYGFPIATWGLLETVLGSIDRIMIGRMLGIIFVGYYSIPLMTKNYVSQLTGFGTVLYPNIIEEFGRHGDAKEIRKYLIVPPQVVGYLLPLLLGVIFFMMPLFIKTVLPKFTPGIIAAQILLIDMFFRSCYPQALYFIISLKKQMRIIPVMLIAILLIISGNYLFIKLGLGINGVAISTSIASLFIFLTIQSYAMRHLANIKEIALFFLDVFLPFLYSFLLIGLLKSTLRIENIFLEALINSALFALFYLPMLVIIQKRTNILVHLMGFLRSRKAKR